MPTPNDFFSKKLPKKLYPLYAALLTLLLYLILYACCGILGYDNNTILSGDLYQQYVAFIRLFTDVLRGKGDFWYSFSLYLGAPTASTFAYYCLSPFNLFYLIPGISSAAMTIIVILLKHAAAAASFQYFAQKGLKRTSPLVILFSVAYAFCAFAVSMQIHIMWLDALYILPILMLLLLNYVKGGSFLPLVPAYAYLFITNFYMGYIVGIFSAFCFIALLVITAKEFNRSVIPAALKKSALYALSVLMAAGCCAAVLLPAAAQLVGQRGGDPMGLRMASISLPDVLGNLFAGQMQGMGSPIPLLYCGLPVLLLLPVYFFSAKISRKEKIAVSLILAFYLIATQFSPIYAFVHAFEAPNWYAHRYAFCCSFLLITLALRALPEHQNYPIRKYGIYCAVLMLFYAILIPIQRLTLGGYPTASVEYLLLNALFLLTYFLCVYKHSAHKETKILPLAFTLLFSAELLCNGYTDITRNSFSYQSEHSIEIQDRLEAAAVTGIQSADPGLYRIRTFGEGMLNAPSYHHYAGVNSFASVDNAKLRSFLSSLGIAAPFAEIYDQGYTELTEMLFGLKYAVFLRDDDIGVSRMPYPLPIAFLSSPSILTWQDTGNPFLNQETLVNSLSGGNTRFFTPVSFENVDTYCQNMETLIIDNVIYYQHIADAAINGIVRYTLTAPTGDRLYGYIPLGSPQVLDTTTATLNVIPSPFTLPYYLSMQTIAEAPVNEDGQPALEIDLVGGPHFDTAVSDVYLYTYDSSAISDTYAALSAGAMQITSWKDGCLSGTVTADAAHPILFTTIPYDKGWTASIDDQPIQVNGILNDTFICLYLPEGTHTITLQYEDPFAAPGAMISVVCAVFFLLLVLLAYRKAHPAAAKNAAAKSSVAESDKEKTDEE